MPSINEVTLLGHLGGDAETRFTPNGVAVTNFSLATTRRWADESKEGGFAEETDWHRIQAWRISDEVQKRLLKGHLVLVKGRLHTRRYTDKDGIERFPVEIVCGPGQVMHMRAPERRGPRDEDVPADMVSSPRSYQRGGSAGNTPEPGEITDEGFLSDERVPF